MKPTSAAAVFIRTKRTLNQSIDWGILSVTHIHLSELLAPFNTNTEISRLSCRTMFCVSYHILLPVLRTPPIPGLENNGNSCRDKPLPCPTACGETSYPIPIRFYPSMLVNPAILLQRSLCCSSRLILSIAAYIISLASRNTLLLLLSRFAADK